MEIKEVVVSSGRMWASAAISGREGCNCRLAVWLELRSMPLGSSTWMPGVAAHAFVCGASLAR